MVSEAADIAISRVVACTPAFLVWRVSGVPPHWTCTGCSAPQRRSLDLRLFRDRLGGWSLHAWHACHTLLQETCDICGSRSPAQQQDPFTSPNLAHFRPNQTGMELVLCRSPLTMLPDIHPGRTLESSTHGSTHFRNGRRRPFVLNGLH